MKTTVAILFMVLLPGYIFPQISTGIVTFNKSEHTAIICKYDYSPSIVEKVFMEQMKYHGYMKSIETKGFKLFPGITLDSLSIQPIDLYIKVEKVKKQKDQALACLLISKGAENFITEASDPQLIMAAGNFLEQLKPALSSEQLEINISDQEKKIKDIEKTFKSLIGKGENLESRKKALEDKIASNRKEQDLQKAQLEKERDLLETLKSQRK